MVESGCRGAKENDERVKCALFGLCTLISSSKWGDLEVEAWKILSDAIVERSPPLLVHGYFRSFRCLSETNPSVLLLRNTFFAHIGKESLPNILKLCACVLLPLDLVVIIARTIVLVRCTPS
jgi:hypothetical protein